MKIIKKSMTTKDKSELVKNKILEKNKNINLDSKYVAYLLNHLKVEFKNKTIEQISDIIIDRYLSSFSNYFRYYEEKSKKNGNETFKAPSIIQYIEKNKHKRLKNPLVTNIEQAIKEKNLEKFYEAVTELKNETGENSFSKKSEEMYYKAKEILSREDVKIMSFSFFKTIMSRNHRYFSPEVRDMVNNRDINGIVQMLRERHSEKPKVGESLSDSYPEIKKTPSESKHDILIKDLLSICGIKHRYKTINNENVFVDFSFDNGISLDIIGSRPEIETKWGEKVTKKMLKCPEYKYLPLWDYAPNYRQLNAYASMLDSSICLKNVGNCGAPLFDFSIEESLIKKIPLLNKYGFQLCNDYIYFLSLVKQNGNLDLLKQDIMTTSQIINFDTQPPSIERIKSKLQTIYKSSHEWDDNTIVAVYFNNASNIKQSTDVIKNKTKEQKIAKIVNWYK